MAIDLGESRCPKLQAPGSVLKRRSDRLRWTRSGLGEAGADRFTNRIHPNLDPVLKRIDDLPAIPRADRHPEAAIDRVADEPDGAVSHRGVHAAGMMGSGTDEGDGRGCPGGIAIGDRAVRWVDLGVARLRG